MSATPAMAPMAMPALAPLLRVLDEEEVAAGEGRGAGLVLTGWLAGLVVEGVVVAAVEEAEVEVEEEEVDVEDEADDDLDWMTIWPFLGLIL